LVRRSRTRIQREAFSGREPSLQDDESGLWIIIEISPGCPLCLEPGVKS
jgi:hypothetical protein